MLSIGEFSDMCQLPPQTLRFYHSEGLLVPADVDERTGYRSYRFDQVEQVMLITVLRGTGMSVELVRRALAEPDTALALLREHRAQVRRTRQAQDEAIEDALRFFGTRPEVSLRHAPGARVVTKPVPDPPAGDGRYDWEEVEAAVAAAVRELTEAVAACGAAVSGVPWRTWDAGTPAWKGQDVTAEGTHWLVHVPVTVGEEATEVLRGALPGDAEVRVFEAREELSIFLPGRSSMAKYGTALSRLFAYPLDGAYPDFTRMRQLLHEDGVETAMPVSRLDGSGGE
ncbi:MerR family transcriptional regulator [Streptomyces sp. TRM 70361]|uniref:MerR family transcriptional regulator n=1 Tax=Streptomyces sp. TRM 70361 TaxID=3116553 RepID=UPI002E7B10F3|nr:MerR family transcriptional regulator [Streptomyces sp. TRM 70361]MEE1943295.1 MerR family transcriptional regulator [Streptomyces sp. TRM 70361]